MSPSCFDAANCGTLALNDFFLTYFCRYKDAHLLLFTGFLPAIDACSFDWPSTEITLCSHIVRKASEIKPSSTELAGITQDFNASNVDVRSDVSIS